MLTMPFPSLEDSDLIVLGYGLDMSIFKVPLSIPLVITKIQGLEYNSSEQQCSLMCYRLNCVSLKFIYVEVPTPSVTVWR